MPPAIPYVISSTLIGIGKGRSQRATTKYIPPAENIVYVALGGGLVFNIKRSIFKSFS